MSALIIHKMVKIKINKLGIGIFFILGLILIGIVYVNGGVRNNVTFGHLGEEIDVSINGNIKNLQRAYNEGDLTGSYSGKRISEIGEIPPCKPGITYCYWSMSDVYNERGYDCEYGKGCWTNVGENRDCVVFNTRIFKEEASSNPLSYCMYNPSTGIVNGTRWAVQIDGDAGYKTMSYCGYACFD